MNNIVTSIINNSNVNIPETLSKNIFYSVYGGSMLFNINNQSSDIDIVSLSITPLNVLYPHLDNKINGYNLSISNDNLMYINNHINYQNNLYDYTIFSIQKFMRLLSVNNPNYLEYLFATEENIIYKDKIGEYLLQHKTDFFNKKCVTHFIGASNTHFDKVLKGNPDGFDYHSKSMCHSVRFLLELEQILNDRNICMKKNADFLLSIRKNEVDFKELCDLRKQLIEKFNNYDRNKLEIKDDNIYYKTLYNILEMHYGNIPKAIYEYSLNNKY